MATLRCEDGDDVARGERLNRRIPLDEHRIVPVDELVADARTIDDRRQYQNDTGGSPQKRANTERG